MLPNTVIRNHILNNNLSNRRPDVKFNDLMQYNKVVRYIIIIKIVRHIRICLQLLTWFIIC